MDKKVLKVGDALYKHNVLDYGETTIREYSVKECRETENGLKYAIKDKLFTYDVYAVIDENLIFEKMERLHRDFSSYFTAPKFHEFYRLSKDEAMKDRAIFIAEEKERRANNE